MKKRIWNKRNTLNPQLWGTASAGSNPYGSHLNASSHLLAFSEFTDTGPPLNATGHYPRVTWPLMNLEGLYWDGKQTQEIIWSTGDPVTPGRSWGQQSGFVWPIHGGFEQSEKAQDMGPDCWKNNGRHGYQGVWFCPYRPAWSGKWDLICCYYCSYLICTLKKNISANIFLYKHKKYLLYIRICMLYVHQVMLSLLTLTYCLLQLGGGAGGECEWSEQYVSI